MGKEYSENTSPEEDAEALDTVATPLESSDVEGAEHKPDFDFAREV